MCGTGFAADEVDTIYGAVRNEGKGEGIADAKEPMYVGTWMEDEIYLLVGSPGVVVREPPPGSSRAASTGQLHVFNGDSRIWVW